MDQPGSLGLWRWQAALAQAALLDIAFANLHFHALSSGSFDVRQNV